MATMQKTRRASKKARSLPQPPAEQLIRLSFVDWPSYIAISDGLGERRVRATYADGEMELMTVSSKHERAKSFLGRLIVALSEELEIDAEGAGNMTIRREVLRRGLEPDDCYWIQHASIICSKESFDADLDPPPDLAVEIEVSRSTLDRMEIYAKLKVPEVWTWDTHTVRFWGLMRGRRYEEITHSRAFPMLRAADLQPCLHLKAGVSQSSVVRSVRQWVREQISKGWKA
jgi:Uma2 family endonuclease